MRLHEKREIEIIRPDINSVVITVKSDTVFKNQILIVTPDEAESLAIKLLDSISGQISASD